MEQICSLQFLQNFVKLCSERVESNPYSCHHFNIILPILEKSRRLIVQDLMMKHHTYTVFLLNVVKCLISRRVYMIHTVLSRPKQYSGGK
jgi:hypothetical protein